MYQTSSEKLKKRGKRKYEIAREPANTTIGEHKIKKIRVKGGNVKNRLLAEKYANVIIDSTYQKCEILSVVDNPANRNFARANIITKGAILKVKKDNKEISVKVTSRPGQDGIINAVLLG
ncbi:MAG: 30S ribosomal protein S8e [Candidatus Altiarchaeum hamiconexum]|uniref:30S ribosomal protein S8e n=1 Tax=Candidatus Altarchaeum hamiconexum TaxID=1803513 RepID=A0A8J7YWH3_9ARCH|nr:30S ribosomal protein S8e [Candidatus Altarchaeum hamiconexum]PIN67294.1 MAG: 30S ribosomal protein S8e [Candidatus Altarchaeum sp. CG12_big_fil_rev_8_21_14_0_65_33_22]PIV28497.1 MAG: 30S ribosomal protein S8e [Candidatus Altarchaeum sp. CG03_land_8_20_14_0_80_32_618]PIX48748.1 MAG: 30S ribosomal protein S8e [Candidatus Altarchaeum sp. CG_4_8_14_3_um_filter_33_2054]PIZ30800.1 MAG: 30S ribosomal protein S8e [Candidatus Altarchaeum sp. CG_4_10_14_0_8_um_filter_32_851]